LSYRRGGGPARADWIEWYPHSPSSPNPVTTNTETTINQIAIRPVVDMRTSNKGRKE
jgi:hypothetical protein